MVLAERVGKKRRFAAGFFLSLVTALVYSIYWNYRAHDEVYRQFELEKDGRDEGVVWYILGIILPPFLLAYWWIMVGNVQYVRDRMRLPRGIKPGAFIALATIAFVAYVGALVLGVIAAGIDPAKATPAQAALSSELLAGAFAFLVVCIAFAGVAYYRLQRDINELWDAYDARMADLTAPAFAPPAAPPPPPAAPALAEWARSPPPL